MGRSKLKKRLALKKELALKEKVLEHNIPIPNLPKKFLWMQVNSSTKIRNVLGFALKDFSNHRSVVWSGTGHGIGKVITCVELFKRKNSGLHQVTKLRYVDSKKSNSDKNEESSETRRVPQIHIWLSKDIVDVEESGYQAPDDPGTFCNSEEEGSLKKSKEDSQRSHSKIGLSAIAMEEFAAMGLRTAQKRPKKGEKVSETPKKKNKKGSNDG